MRTVFALPQAAFATTARVIAASGGRASEVIALTSSPTLDVDWIVLGDGAASGWAGYLERATDGCVVDRDRVLQLLRRPADQNEALDGVRVSAGFVIHGDEAIAQALSERAEQQAGHAEDVDAMVRAAARYLVAGAEHVLLASSTAQRLGLLAALR